MTRKQREDRAYKLVLATGASSTVAVISAILALTPFLGSGLPILAALIAVLCFIMLRRTLGR